MSFCIWLAFYHDVIYTHTVMNFEENQQQQMAPHVDEVFGNMSNKTPKERIAIAAFDMVPLVDAVKTSEEEVIKAWQAAGVETQTSFRALMSAFGSTLLKKIWNFESLGRAFTAGASDGTPLLETSPAPEPEVRLVDAEVQKIEAISIEASARLDSARALLPSLYNLTPREVRAAEAIARDPWRIERL